MYERTHAQEKLEGTGNMKTGRTASLALLWLVLTVSPGLAEDRLRGCSGWDADTLIDFAHRADLSFNRDRHGLPILYALTMAIWLMERGRWGDAARRLIGFDQSFWLIPGRGGVHVPAIVGKITAVLHDCGASLGPDYSSGMIPAMEFPPGRSPKPG